MRDRGGPIATAKGPRDLLLDFDHPEIPFRQIVGKGQGEDIEDNQHIFGSHKKSIEQIFGGVLFVATRLFRQTGRGLEVMSGKTLRQDLEILSQKIITHRLGQGGCALLPPLFGRMIHQPEQLKHLLTPELVFLLSHKEAITEHMRSTQAMSAGKLIRAGPAVMHCPASEVRPDLQSSHCLLPAPAVPPVVSERRGCRHMDPMQQPLDPHPGFISMDEITLQEQRFDPFLGRLSPMNNLLDPGD